LSDFEALKERHPTATFIELESGAALVSVPFTLPVGWNTTEVTLRFLVPNGYPVAPPDSFWIEPNLIVNGDKPGNSNWDQAIPETELKGNFFSWHFESGRWSPNRDNLIMWLRSCRDRLEQIK